MKTCFPLVLNSEWVTPYLKVIWASDTCLWYFKMIAEAFCLHVSNWAGIDTLQMTYFFSEEDRRIHKGPSFSNGNVAWLTHTELINMTFVMFLCYVHNGPCLVRARGGHWDAVCPCSAIRHCPRLTLEPHPPLLFQTSSHSAVSEETICVTAITSSRQSTWLQHTHCFCGYRACIFFIYLILLWICLATAHPPTSEWSE